MPFWKRSSGDEPPPSVIESHRLSDAIARLEGSLRCSEHGCDLASGVPCQYVDRRNRTCKSAWCPNHRIVVDGQVYCRRHAGVISALPQDGHSSSPLPDLENRAPSLVSWVARELDADIRGALLAEIDEATGGQLIADPVYLIFVGPERVRTWERAWKLAAHTGATLRVALLVEEEADTEVKVKIGSNVLGAVVPPWITKRTNEPPPLTASADVERRAAFNEEVLAIIRDGLAHEHALSRTADAEERMVHRIYHRTN